MVRMRQPVQFVPTFDSISEQPAEQGQVPVGIDLTVKISVELNCRHWNRSVTCSENFNSKINFLTITRKPTNHRISNHRVLGEFGGMRYEISHGNRIELFESIYNLSSN